MNDDATDGAVSPETDDVTTLVLDTADGEPGMRPHLSFPVVGVGASAGCVSALCTLFEQMPATSGMAFVIVVHLSPQHESSLDDILARVTAMPVLQVRERVRIEPDHVYLISPAVQLAMSDGHLEVTPHAGRRGLRMTIDHFFRTLAAAQRERAYGVVLSGTGSDGTLGLQRIKECGGVALVQLPEDAEYGDMPGNAIASGAVDLVLPAAEIGPRLADLWQNLRRIEIPSPIAETIKAAAPPTLAAAQEAEEALAEILRLVKSRTGHDFRHYKRATLLRRIERRLQVTTLPTLPAYRDHLTQHTDETRALLKDLLISVTNFFRDRDAFDALGREVRALLQMQPAAHPRLRAWVAGCATGEEAYSIAMLLADSAADLRVKLELQVFASDIDEPAIAYARAGRYPDSVLNDLVPAQLRRYFNKDQRHVVVRKELRENVLFAVHNLLRDPPFSNLDLICCRNLLIYLDRQMQQQVLQVFHFALKPRGLLFLGMSESADVASDLFETVDKKHRIYRADGVRRASRSHAIRGQLPPPRFDIAAAAAAAAPPVVPLTAPQPQDAIGRLHQRLCEAQQPPSVLIDVEGNVLHSSGSIAAFLQFAAGLPSRKLLDAVRPELRVALRAALFRATQERQSVASRRVCMTVEGRPVWVGIDVRPVAAEGSALLLVSFEAVDSTFGPEAANPTEKDPMLAVLEDELQRTRAQLHGSIGESAASNEELRASNEELQAINEELRSATEELETGKEELQSVNEELVTVNQELKVKIDETSKVNDDLTNLIASTDIATVFVDRAMQIKRFTPRASQLFHLIGSDVGRSLLDITNRLDYEQLEHDAQAAFESLRTTEREVEDRNGRVWLVRILPYRTRQDLIDGAVLTFVDISATRAAQRQLKVSEVNLQRAIESTKDYAIITLDTNGCVTGWNAGATLLFGYAPPEMVGEPIDLIFTPEDQAADAPRKELQRARDDGHAADERWHMAKDGTRRYVSGVVTPLHEHGELIGFAKIARDLTESKRVGLQLEALLAKEQQAATELARAFALKDEFLAVMSHELKHPLNLIHVNAELIARMPQVREVPAVAQAADVIRRAVLGQAKIIDDLLDLSRLRTGKLSLKRQPVLWGKLVLRVIDVIRAEAAEHRLALEVDLDEEASAIDADPVRVEQIVWNLLSNAIKFTPEGGSIRVRLSRDGALARLDVQDTGMGLAPEMLDELFDMFRQADRTAARARGGMGIGLALVRQLANAHGGRAVATSPGLGQGATFSVWLPRSAQAQGAQEQGAGARPFEGLRVLVVDDTIDSRDAFALVLELEGAQVCAVGSGKEALAAAAAAPFDLILSDIAMPGMDGYQLMEALRAAPGSARVPAIALTGFGRAQDAQRALAAGFNAHLAKPVVIDQLFEVVERLVPLRRDQ